MGGGVLNLPAIRAYEDGETKGKAEGKIETLVSLVNDGLISEMEAAIRLDMSLEEFRKHAKGIKS